MSQDLNWIQRKILEHEMTDFLKKYWPTITATLGTLIPFLMPSLLTYVSAHPHTALGVLFGCVIAAYHSTAPQDQTKETK